MQEDSGKSKPIASLRFYSDALKDPSLPRKHASGGESLRYLYSVGMNQLDLPEVLFMIGEGDGCGHYTEEDQDEIVKGAIALVQCFVQYPDEYSFQLGMQYVDSIGRVYTLSLYLPEDEYRVKHRHMVEAVKYYEGSKFPAYVFRPSTWVN